MSWRFCTASARTKVLPQWPALTKGCRPPSPPSAWPVDPHRSEVSVILNLCAARSALSNLESLWSSPTSSLRSGGSVANETGRSVLASRQVAEVVARRPPNWGSIPAALEFTKGSAAPPSNQKRLPLPLPSFLPPFTCSQLRWLSLRQYSHLWARPPGQTAEHPSEFRFQSQQSSVPSASTRNLP